MDIYRQQFGRRLKEALQSAKRNQSWLAEKLEVKDSTVSRWINGKDFPRDRLADICKLLKVPLQFFDPGNPEPGLTPIEISRAVAELVKAGPVMRNTVLFLLLGDESYIEQLPPALRQQLESLHVAP